MTITPQEFHMNTSEAIATDAASVSPLENRHAAVALSLLAPVIALAHISWQMLAPMQGIAVLLAHLGILALGAMTVSSIVLSALSLEPSRRLEARLGVRMLVAVSVLLSISFAITWTMATSNMTPSSLG
jgi:hypothetical protein